MSELNIEFLLLALAWLASVVVTARLSMRSADGSVGLPAAFLFAMSFMYFGFVTYIVPGYSHLRAGGDLYLQTYDFTDETVRLGVWASCIGVAGFAVGTWLMQIRGARRVRRNRPALLSRSTRRRLLWSLGAFSIAGFVLNGANLPIPMLQAIAQAGRNVAVVTVCLGAVLALQGEGRQTYWRWVAAAAAIPAAYLLLWGFVSYGFLVFTCFAGFWLAVLAPRRLSAATTGGGAAAITYGLLSIFVAWMSFRDELRAVLWKAEASMAQRIDAVIDAFAKTELLSPWNFASLDWLNTRLNQYIFVGKAIEWHDLWPALRLHGETILIAALAWVPRFLWPDKPEMGGSRLVSEHTGMRFSESSTFGAGPVFEFYVNFGLAGVFIGFVFLAMLVRMIDSGAARALRDGRLMDFVRLFAVGIVFVNPLTDFFFMINTAIMTWLILTGLKVLLQSRPAGHMHPGHRARGYE